MIKIKESTPLKISGETSLFLSFPFNESVISIVKGCSSYKFHEKLRQWEVPATSLAYLLDNLIFYDSVDLELIPEDTNKEKLSITLDYKVPPFDYQREGIEYGLNHKNWLLLDEPGLGKTAQIIHIAEELKAQKGLKHCLIICGLASLRANWEKEIKKHSDLSCVVIGKKVSRNKTVRWMRQNERAAQLSKPIDEFFIIINIESIRYSTSKKKENQNGVLNALLKNVSGIDMVVLDECHKCAGAGSQQSEGLLKLINYEYKIGLTGTLLTNSPLSAYVPLKWIGVEHANLTKFKNQYCVFGGFGGHQIIGFKNIDLLSAELETCSLRRTKDLIDIPPKNVINEIVEMNDSHQEFYEMVKGGVKEECDKIKLDARNTLALTTRLRQATTCPSLLTTSPVTSSKIERCCELVDDIISQGDKVVIFSTYKEPVYKLQQLLADYHPLIGTGDQGDQELSDNVDMFQEDDYHKVFIATVSKCGTGLNLNRARYLIMLDSPLTYALWQQATDRIHRVNNKEPVFVYNLICENTIDEKVNEIVERKRALLEFVVDKEEDAAEALKEYILDLE